MLKFLTSSGSGSLLLDDDGSRLAKKISGGSLSPEGCGLTEVECGLSPEVAVGRAPFPEKSAGRCGLKTGVVRCGTGAV